MSSSIFRHWTTGRDLARQLTDAGVTLPDEVTDALQQLSRHIARQPEPTGLQAVADAYINSEKSDKVIAGMAAQAAASDLHQRAWKSARDHLGGDVKRALHATAGDIVPQLADLAQPLIAALTKLADLPSLDAGVLLQNGTDPDLAREAAIVEQTAAKLNSLFALRDRLTGDTPYGTASHFRNPAKAKRGDTPARVWVDSIRNGAEPWMPDPDQAQKRSRDLAAKRKQQQADALVEQAKGGAQFFGP